MIHFQSIPTVTVHRVIWSVIWSHLSTTFAIHSFYNLAVIFLHSFLVPLFTGLPLDKYFPIEVLEIWTAQPCTMWRPLSRWPMHSSLQVVGHPIPLHSWGIAALLPRQYMQASLIKTRHYPQSYAEKRSPVLLFWTSYKDAGLRWSDWYVEVINKGPKMWSISFIIRKDSTISGGP